MSRSVSYRRAIAPTLVLVAAWFGLALVRSLYNLANPDIAIGQSPLFILSFVLLPLVAFFAAAAALPAFRALIGAVDLRWIILSQYGRIVGGVFVLYEARGLLPAGFAWPAGWGDFAIGLAAPLLVLAITLRGSGARGAFYLWSALGILDLVAAVSLGLLHSSTPLGLLRGPVSMDPVAWFPLSLIPTFAVPAYLIAHAIALMRAGEIPAAARAAPA